MPGMAYDGSYSAGKGKSGQMAGEAMTSSDNIHKTGFEANLACGDTVTFTNCPPVGSYRFCIHCDKRQRVTGYPEQTKTIAEWYAPLTSRERDDLYWTIRAGYRAEVGLISHDAERGLVSQSLLALNCDTIGLLADLASA